MSIQSRSWFIFAVAAACALGAGVWTASVGRTSSDAAPLLALSLPDTEGAPQRLDQWRGQVIVVNFWATWCGPCREEMPELVRAQKDFGAKGLQIVGIAVDNADKVRQFVKDFGLNYPALIGGYGAVDISKDLGNRLAALPFTIIVDRKGKVVQTTLGPVKIDQFRSKIASLL